MLPKIKLQLTFTKNAIMIIIFLIISIGAYFFIKTTILNNARLLTKRLAFEIKSQALGGAKLPKPSNLKNSSPETPLLFSYLLSDKVPSDNFFVRIDLSGNIIENSTLQPLNREQLTALAQITFIMKKNSGIIAFLSNKYFYYKTVMSNQPEVLIVYHNLRPEENALLVLTILAVITGISFLFLTFAMKKQSCSCRKEQKKI